WCPMPNDGQTRTALGVEKLESRALPSAGLPPPIHATGDGTFTFAPPGDSPVVNDGQFVPPGFAGGTPANDVAQVWQHTENGGVSLPVAPNYHVTTGFFGE